MDSLHIEPEKWSFNIWCQHEQAIENTSEVAVIWGAETLM